MPEADQLRCRMQLKRSMWKSPILWVVALVLLAGRGTRGLTAPLQTAGDAPKPLPHEIVDTWKKAGAAVGWMRMADRGHLVFHSGPEGAAGDWPAFGFS